MTYPQQYPPQPAPAGPPGYPTAPQQQYATPAPPAGPPPQGYGQMPAGPTSFAAPAATAGGDMLKPEQVNGHLLIVVPHEFLMNIQTSQGPSDAIRINVVDLDAPGPDGQPGRTYRDVLWFSKVLRNSLRRQLEEQGRVFVLGTMGRGTQRGNNSPPWILQDQTGNPNAVERAQQFLARRPNWQAEPGDFAEQRAQQAAQATGPHQWPAGAQPPAQQWPGVQQTPNAYPPAGLVPQQPAQPYGQPPAGYPPTPAGPPPGYPPQQYAAPAPGPVAQPGDPAVAALYGQIGHPQGVPPQP